MFRTKEVILQDLLQSVDSKYDTRIGTLVYELLSVVSIEQEKTYGEIKSILDKLDVRNLKGTDLDRYVEQTSDKVRYKKMSSKAVLSVNGNGTISKGALFETASGIQFKALALTEINNAGSCEVEAVVAGSKGNVMANTITQIPVTIPGIISVTNSKAAELGRDEETDVSLIERYLSSQREDTTQGNQASYKAWAEEIPNVGDVKIFPLQSLNGDAKDNAVLLVVINADKKPAGSDLITLLQNHLNPLDKDGHGEGRAPIGAYVYVKAADQLDITISCQIKLKTGFTLDQVKLKVEENIKAFLKGIAFKESIVSHAKLGNVVLETEGVEDYSNLTVNGGSVNVTIPNKSVAVLGGVTTVEQS